MFSFLFALVLLGGGLRPTPLPNSEDWPQWGGPKRTGVSAETGWSSQGKPEPMWKTEVGLGYSSVAIAAKRLYTLGHDKEAELDVVHCLDADTGAEVWTYTFPSKLMDLYHGGGTLTTPTVDGEVVYVSEREGKLFCLEAKSGDVVWQKDAKKEFALDLPQWGFAASPVVLGDTLILNYGRIFAFDKKTGKELWSTKKSYGASYSTPVDLALGEQKALATFGGTGLVVLAAKDGAELSFLPWKTQYEINAMTPRVFDRRVFISSGYDHGCALVDLAAKEPKIVWESKVMRNQMSGAVPWKDCLYGFDEKVLKCIDLEGKELWRERGLGQGALTIADGRLIVMSEEGELVVAEATSEAFKELARTKVFDGGTCWTVPVLANGVIYVRNHAGELAALDHRKP
jgi:outer membrane protein assembly factor BamB